MCNIHNEHWIFLKWMCVFLHPYLWFSSVQFSHSVMFDSLRPHGLQHARLLCPLPSPGVCSNSYPLSNAIWPSHPLASPPPPALNFPSIRIFSNESALCIEWPNYCSFSFSLSPSNEQPRLISFRIETWILILQNTNATLFPQTPPISQVQGLTPQR